MTKISFIGLGKMGAGMAACLVKAGFDVTVSNRSADKAQPLLDLGATFAETPAEAAKDANFVITMVGDDHASRAIWTGPNGILKGRCAPNAIMIECSTLSASWVKMLSALVEANGYRYLDMPVTGLPHHAAAGELTLLAGGDPITMDEARPVLSAMSHKILHFGDVGAGSAYKLIVNLTGAVQIAATAEAIKMAKSAGLDLDLVADSLATGASGSLQVQLNAPKMIKDANTVDVTFSAALRHKDTAYALDFANDCGVASPLGEAVLDYYKRLLDNGRGEEDQSRIVDIL